MSSYAEFPRMVYGPDGATMVISREEERPDGFVNHPDDLVGAAAAEVVAAEAAAKDAEKALREGYKDFLDRYSVVYAKNLSTPKLAELVSQLEDHLAAEDTEHGDGE